MDNIENTLEERGSRYGSFEGNAYLSQRLKLIMRHSDNWSKLLPQARESLDMIQLKIGRILNGDPDYLDSWEDIEGYAHLISTKIKKDRKLS